MNLNKIKKDIVSVAKANFMTLFGAEFNLSATKGRIVQGTCGVYLWVSEDAQEVIFGSVNDPTINLSFPMESNRLIERRRAIETTILKVISLKYIPSAAVENDKAVQFYQKALGNLKAIRWHRGYEAQLLLAWCVLAPFGAMLKYRPHLWLSGLSASGKTWVLNHVVQPLLKDLCTHYDGFSQEIVNQPAPVIIDEFEGLCASSKAAQQKAVLKLRIASTSKTPAPCALVSSTRRPRLAEVDQNRFLVLELQKNKQKKKWKMAKRFFEDDWARNKSLLFDYVYSRVDLLIKHIVEAEIYMERRFPETPAHIIRSMAALHATGKMFNRPLKLDQQREIIAEYEERVEGEDAKAIKALMNTPFKAYSNEVTLYSLVDNVVYSDGDSKLLKECGCRVVDIQGDDVTLGVKLNNPIVKLQIMESYAQDVSNWQQIIRSSHRVSSVDRSEVLIKGVLRA